jgi:hypothetical protein
LTVYTATLEIMPPTSVLNSTTTQSSRGKFELPALSIEPVSLTAGTNIPPPPESPIAEEPPSTQPEPENASAVADGTPVNGNYPPVTEVYTGRGRTIGNGLSSPISLKRPSSIRRFLSRKSLYSNYADGTDGSHSQENLNGDGFRPESPSAFSTTSKSTAGKRSGSWFRRFTGSGFDEPNAKRASIVYEENASPQGPPPPVLPELNQLKAKIAVDDDGSLGGAELFKDIK